MYEPVTQHSCYNDVLFLVCGVEQSYCSGVLLCVCVSSANQNLLPYCACGTIDRLVYDMISTTVYEQLRGQLEHLCLTVNLQGHIVTVS